MADSRRVKYMLGKQYLAFCNSRHGKTEASRLKWRDQHSPGTPLTILDRYALLPLYGSYNACLKFGFWRVYEQLHLREQLPPTIQCWYKRVFQYFFK